LLLRRVRRRNEPGASFRLILHFSIVSILRYSSALTRISLTIKTPLFLSNQACFHAFECESGRKRNDGDVDSAAVTNESDDDDAAGGTIAADAGRCDVKALLCALAAASSSSSSSSLSSPTAVVVAAVADPASGSGGSLAARAAFMFNLFSTPSAVGTVAGARVLTSAALVQLLAAVRLLRPNRRVNARRRALYVAALKRVTMQVWMHDVVDSVFGDAAGESDAVDAGLTKADFQLVVAALPAAFTL
jgi:hypothetical protein